MSSNQAAWITAPKAYPFTIGDAPKPTPGPGEIVIKNAAVAINPVDWKIQVHGAFLDKYPFILGEDLAGIVEEVGPGAHRFTKGQRVFSHSHTLLSKNPANSAFQLYTLVKEDLTAAIPDSLTFEQAVVLPLAIDTAAVGLYQEDHLNLPLPSPTGAEATGKTILLWGGASSVGIAAIQLAVASGLHVVTTASQHNHQLVRDLGASVVLHYKSPTIVDDVAAALQDTDLVGVYDAIAETQSFEPVAAILEKLNKTVKIASVLPYKQPTERFAPRFIGALSLIVEPNLAIAKGVWQDFIPAALANGHLKAKPDPLVVGNGLGDIQHALDVQKAGVSAKKVVVTL